MKANQPSRPAWLYRYTIACADMYYTELEQRNVYAYNDPDRGFRIWGETPGTGPSSEIDLCQMFLEYAMYCRSWCSLEEATYNMCRFGELLGNALANYLRENPPGDMASNPGACALMCVLESMDGQFTVEQVGPELYFTFVDCPLLETAQRTGLSEVDLALQGVNAMCQSLIHAVDAHLAVQTPLEAHTIPIFSLRTFV